MSTFTAVGPALDLDGPLPVAPPHSLLLTEGVVVERDATRVLNGVNVWGYPEDCPSLWEPCGDGTFQVKEDDSTQSVPRFDAFVVYTPITCSPMNVGNDLDELNRRAVAVLEATESSGIERALAAGVTQSSNPFFGDGNVSKPNGNTAVSARVGFSFMEQAIGGTCRAGLIHATPAAIVAAQTYPVSDRIQDMLVTTNGTKVVSGMGYQGVGPTGALPTPGATQDWLFATGPVQVYLGPLVVTTPRESLDRSDNTLTFRAERYVVALWDTALQAAVLVDWSS